MRSFLVVIYREIPESLISSKFEIKQQFLLKGWTCKSIEKRVQQMIEADVIRIQHEGEDLPVEEIQVCISTLRKAKKEMRGLGILHEKLLVKRQERKNKGLSFKYNKPFIKEKR